MVGVLPTFEARQLAIQAGLDLVEISPSADPPVCRIMDFGKFRYETSRKEKEARKHQSSAVLKEMKFHSNVAEHDFHTKVNHIRDFLDKGHRVKGSLFFRGRENAHRDIGFEVMKRVVKECEDVATIEMAPKMMGNSIIMILGPKLSRSGGGVRKPDPVPQPPPQSPPRPPPPPAVQAAPAQVPVAAPASAPVPGPVQ